MTAAALVVALALLLAACVDVASAASAFGGRSPVGQAGWFHQPAKFPNKKITTTTTMSALLEKMRGGASKKKKTEESSSSPEETAADVVDLYLPGLLEATVIRTNKVRLGYLYDRLLLRSI
jgi:Spy/CpxP family protein refolding chaperone